MYCIKCGKEIRDDVAFCPYCGAKQTEDKPAVKIESDNKTVTKGKTNFLLFAGIAFGVIALINLLKIIDYFYITDFLVMLVAAAISVFCFLKKDAFVAIGLGVYSLIVLIEALAGGYYWHYALLNVLTALAIAYPCAYYFFLHKVNLPKWFMFIPIGLILVYHYSEVFYYYRWFIFDIIYNFDWYYVLTVLGLLEELFLAAGIFFVILHFGKGETKKVSPSTPFKKEEDYVERLKKLKSYLDSGIITQEEFDAKKKEILNI